MPRKKRTRLTQRKGTSIGGRSTKKTTTDGSRQATQSSVSSSTESLPSKRCKTASLSVDGISTNLPAPSQPRHDVSADVSLQPAVNVVVGLDASEKGKVIPPNEGSVSDFDKYPSSVATPRRSERIHKRTSETSVLSVPNEQSSLIHCSKNVEVNKIRRRPSLDDSSASESEESRPHQLVISAMVHHVELIQSQHSNNIEINQSPVLHSISITPAPVHTTLVRRMSLDDSSDEEIEPIIRHVTETAIVHESADRTEVPVAPEILHQHSPGRRIHTATYDEILIDLPEHIDVVHSPLPAVEPPNIIPVPLEPLHNINIEEQIAIMREQLEAERLRRRLPTLLLAIERTLPANHPVSYLGPLNCECNHCGALHFRTEMTTRREFDTCCSRGQVVLPDLQPMPDLLDALFRGQHPHSNEFTKKALQYNHAFQFASLQATLRDLPPNRRAPSVYAIQGKIHHHISNINLNERNPRFGPVYFLTPEQGVNARANANPNLDVGLMRTIDNLLRRINPYAVGYMHLHERYQAELVAIENERRNHPVPGPLPMPTVSLELLPVRGRENRRYDLPVVDEVAAVYRVHTDDPVTPNLKIYVRDHPDVFHTLRYTNETVQPLTFPLLFPRGDTGWHPGMPLANNIRKNISICKYYGYRLALRQRETRFVYAHKLGQQFIVNAYIDIESSRLDFIRNNQDRLRAEQYLGLADFLVRRGLQNNIDDDPAHLGRMIILPSSFAGSPRSQYQHYQDAMAVVCKYGHPSFFITMTTNPKWREITENIPRGHQATNHPMLLSRTFKCKWDQLLADLLDLKIFGDAVANLSVIEFQKRGLPHSHNLLILRNADKIIDAQQIDRFICAEIPDPVNEPELYEIVLRNMIHNPCDRNPDAVCLIDGVCSKGFPKPFSNGTIIQESGRIIYRRRNHGRTVAITYNGTHYEMDNRWVVPYNPFCLLKYNCHINLEACVTANSVKYLYKYFFKGADHALVRVAADFQEPQLQYDEIESFLSGRYMSPPESSWKILQFPMIRNTHTIYRLCVHLPERQVVRFQPGNEVEALQRNEITQLTGWFLLNQNDDNAREYLYAEIPFHYVWQPATRRWTVRRKGGDKIITRMYSVNVRNHELYSLRTLLLHKRGATSFEDLRTVDGHICDTFLQACQLMNLMADDVEWRRALREASQRDMPYQLRCMFSYMLLFCEVTDKLALWEEFRPYFIEDFVRRGIDYDVAVQRCLAHIQSILTVNGARLSDFGLPEPRLADADDAPVPDLQAMHLEGVRLRNQLNPEQAAIYDNVYRAVHDDRQPDRLFFVNAAAGTGKSFLFQTLLTVFHSEEIAFIACAPTGIAAMLLRDGRTLHSRFKLPLEINETTTASVTRTSEAGRLIMSAKILIIDEISMVRRSIFKIVERTVKDLCREDDRPFAHKVVIVAGDFRQTLPIIPGGFREIIVEECVRDTLDILNFTKYDLLTNMRARADQQQFSQWLLELGNDTLPPFIRSHYGNLIQLPPQCVATSKEELIEFCLGDLDFDFISNNAILTPLNVTCHDINDSVIDRLPGEYTTYLSSDSIQDADEPDIEYANYSIEFLNTLQPGGFPPHRLKLKVGCIVVLLRNLNLKKGLCNGTRLLIRVLGNRYLDAEKMDQSGRLTQERVFIPRIDLTGSNSTLPFKLKRRQFPVKLAYCMTINKSQGQTCERVGIYLPMPVFSHGQLYVAFSRARGFDKVKIYVEDSALQGKLNRQQPNAVYTRNVVYREVL